MNRIVGAFNAGHLLAGPHPRKSGARPPSRLVFIGQHKPGRSWHLEETTWSLVYMDAEWDLSTDDCPRTGAPSEHAVERVAEILDIHPEEVYLTTAFTWTEEAP